MKQEDICKMYSPLGVIGLVKFKCKCCGMTFIGTDDPEYCSRSCREGWADLMFKKARKIKKARDKKP